MNISGLCRVCFERPFQSLLERLYTISYFPIVENIFFGGIFAMSAKLNIDASKFFEVNLLDRPFLSTIDLFKKLFGWIPLWLPLHLFLNFN
jgi:hypothetical protein